MIKKSSLLMIPALWVAGCNLEPADTADSPASGRPAVAPDAWQALPEGKNFLLEGYDADGTPRFTPVRLTDTMAFIEDDIIVAVGASQMEKLRAELVDPKDFKTKGLAKTSGFIRSSALSGGANAWPNGFIPYLIGGGVDKYKIEQAIYEFNMSGSGITFVPRKTTDAQGVVFVPSTEQVSSSAVGLTTPGAWQGIYLVSNSDVRTIMHEMGHAAGLYHEHVRPDRNNYVTITTSGVDQLGMWGRGYAISNDGTTVGDYDYKSIMHYTNGTVTFTNPDKSLYKVTLTAKNGTSTGNSQLSAGDKVSVWNIPITQVPFIGGSSLSNTAGKVIKPFFTSPNGVTKRWLLTYDQATGNSNVTALNDDNTVGNSVQNFFVGSGFNIVIPYTAGNGTPCMLFYSTGSGKVKLFSVIAAGGALNPAPLADTYWNTGWTTIEYYSVGLKGYWFFQNASSQLVNIWAVTANGTLGGLTYNATWQGWVYSKPFYIETSVASMTTYFLFRTNAGLTRIRQMTAEGTLGDFYVDQQLANFPTVGMWQSVGKAYLAVANGAQLFVYDFDNNGFRNTGSPIFRVANMGRTVAKIEATSYIYSVNNSGTFVNNKMYDFKHVAIMNWSGIPNYAYTGFMAPYH